MQLTSAASVLAPGGLSRPVSTRGGLSRLATPRVRRAKRTSERRARAALEALGDAGAISAVTHGAQQLWDTAVGVGLPCTVQQCGDVIYRSTLDPKLRLEESNIFTTGGWALLGVALTYLSITPKPGWGFIDYYILDKLSPRRPKKLSIDDFKFTMKLGAGGFGSVYRATVVPGGQLQEEEVVLKRAEQFGQEEEWMNRRMMRAHPEAAALFLQSFSDPRLPPQVASAPSNRPFELYLDLDELKQNLPWMKSKEEPVVADPVWLIWKLEGTQNLANVINSKDFPYDMEVPILGRELSDMPRGPARKAVTIKALFNQVVKCLDAMHGMGIVHRDVKCENLVLTNDSVPGAARLKLIDFGGAADLRIGLNYAPKEYLMDPRYAAPEQYIMSTQTAEPPAVPVALLLSPILWQLNLPDRFDLWSAGLILLQMCLPSLRTDGALIGMRKALDRNGQDVALWREQTQKRAPVRADDQEGWDILDANDGAGWELVQALLKPEAALRPSAVQVRRHPFVTGKRRITAIIDGAVRSLTEDAKVGKQSKWVLRRMARSGTQEVGGFTEAQMEKLQALERVPTKDEAQFILARYVAQTMAEGAGKNGSGKANGKPNGKAAAFSGKVGGYDDGPDNRFGNGNGAAAAKLLQPALQLAAMMGAASGSLRNGKGNGNGGAATAEPSVAEEAVADAEEILVSEDAPPKRRNFQYVSGTRAAVARMGFMQKLNYWGRFGPQE